MAKGQKKDDVLYRVIKFEISPSEAQLSVLKKISDNLWLVWNEALEERQKNFNTHVAPYYEALKNLKKGGEALAIAPRLTNNIAVVEPALAEQLLKKGLSDAYKEHRVMLFDQINALTPRRQKDEAFGKVPRNWQEETLDTLESAFKSFIALRKHGDPDAKPPKLRDEWGFCEIPGRYGFKLEGGGKKLALSCGKIGNGVEFSFPIPEAYQFGKLSRAMKLKKFTLYRDPRDLRENGRFWISLAYEIPKPQEKPFDPERAVFVALGASWIGIVSPHGEEAIPTWRCDRFWKPKTDAVGERIFRESSGTNVHALTKGSRAWKKRTAARRTMFRIMRAQQKQDRREIVALDLLLFHGVHFVLSDIVVRSKEGKLADGSKTERGGSLGLNWSAQNTGSIAYLAQWLEEKAKEYGGTVRRYRLPTELVPPGHGRENKIPMARALRDDFLRSFKRGKVA